MARMIALGLVVLGALAAPCRSCPPHRSPSASSHSQDGSCRSRKSSRDLDAQLTRATLALRQGRVEAALADLNDALAIFPQARAYKLRAQVWLRKWDLHAAQADLTRALELAPQDTAALINRSGILLVQRQYGAAIADCNEALRVNPRCGAAHANRGAAQLKLGKHEEALADFNRAIELNPLDIEALANRAQLSAKMQDWKQVVADCSRLLLYKPGWRKYRLLRLNAYLALNQLPTALLEVSTLLQTGGHGPADAACFRECGDLYLLGAQLEEKCLQLLLSRGGNPTGPEHQADFVRRQQSKIAADRRRAIAAYQEAIRLEPSFPDCYLKRASACLLLGDDHQAIRDCTHALSLQPASREAHILRLRAFLACTDLASATADCTDLIQLCSSNEDRGRWLAERARLHELQKAMDRAASDYSDLVELEPENPLVWQKRGSFFARQGKYHLAEQDLKLALQLASRREDPGILAGLHLQQGRILLHLGDLRAAAQEYAYLWEHFPGRGDLQVERAVILALAGEYVEAVEKLWNLGPLTRTTGGLITHSAADLLSGLPLSRMLSHLSRAMPSWLLRPLPGSADECDSDRPAARER